MSKLLDAIEARRTGKHMAEITPVSVTEDYNKCNDIQHYSRLAEYRIEVKIGAMVQLHDNTEALQQAIYDTKRYLQQYVFGEFREPLYELQIAISNNDREESRKLLNEILESMFGA